MLNGHAHPFYRRQVPYKVIKTRESCKTCLTNRTRPISHHILLCNLPIIFGCQLCWQSFNNVLNCLLSYVMSYQLVHCCKALIIIIIIIIISRHWLLMASGADTQTQRHRHTHARAHTDMRTQETRRAWFKNTSHLWLKWKIHKFTPWCTNY